jgi:hypothetical protein
MGSLSIQLSVDDLPRADRVQVGPPVEEKSDPAAAEPDRKGQRDPEAKIMEASDQPAGQAADWAQSRRIWLDGHRSLHRLCPGKADHGEIVWRGSRAFQGNFQGTGWTGMNKNDSRSTLLPSPMRQQSRRECAKLVLAGSRGLHRRGIMVPCKATYPLVTARVRTLRISFRAEPIPRAGATGNRKNAADRRSDGRNWLMRVSGTARGQWRSP